ncbi:MAG TPA: RIP metalloprotease RseP [Candidatus Binataceae bacterium]|nr:RIP metalloprotease RseP [Candidatus Binataceae bacterium]
MLLSIASAVIIFAVLIIVHEAGHFAMAKRLGVRVLRFSVGYPPRIFGIRRGETDYAIGATPFGGYVRMLGDEVAEDPSPATLEEYLREIETDLKLALNNDAPGKSGMDSEPALIAFAREFESGSHAAAVSKLGREAKTDEAMLLGAMAATGSAAEAIKALAVERPRALIECFRARAFPTQSLGKRIGIVIAGPLANILFAPILMAAVFMYGVPYVKPIVGEMKAGMPAASAGLKPGDRIVAVAGKSVRTWNDLSDAIRGSGGASIALDIARPNGSVSPEHLTLRIQPVREDEKTIYGNSTAAWVIGVLPRGDEGVRHYGPLSAIGQSVIATGEMAGQLVIGIVRIIDGSTPARQALGGPIMIAQIAGREAHQGFADLGGFTVMLSLELGIINLLPVPLLDGGHLFFFLLEGVRGRPLQLRHREYAMRVGLLLLVALMTFVIFNDISRIIHG